MTPKTKAFISAARLRTLPLSVAGIIAGTAMAHTQGTFNPFIFVLALLTTIGFQVLSNFANDYGDGVKGTDNQDRVGPERALQSGLVSPKEMKKAIILTVLITLVVSILLIYISFGDSNPGYSVFFFLLGIAALASAIKYTVGKTAYGYHGLGDVFVFVFFGLVSVVGSYFLYSKNIPATIFLPAATIGFLSMAVLNLNNMRDEESDKKAGKRTLVVLKGKQFARAYHYTIIITAIICALIYAVLKATAWYNYLFVLAFIPLTIHLLKFSRTKEHKLLDPELKKIALSTFLFAVLFYLGFNIFL